MKTSKETISTFCLIINHIPIHGERNEIIQQLASDSPLTHQSQPSNHTRDLSSKALRQQKIWSTRGVTPRQPNRDGRTPSTGAWLRPFTRVFVVGDSFTRTTKKDGEGKNKIILITHLWSTKHPCYVSYNQTRNTEHWRKRKKKNCRNSSVVQRHESSTRGRTDQHGLFYRDHLRNLVFDVCLGHRTRTDNSKNQ